MKNGNTLAEYGLMLGLLALLIVGGLKLLGGSMNTMYERPNTKFAPIQMKQYVSLQFSPTSGNISGQLKSANTLATPTLGLNSGTSGGINATSVEGTTPYITGDIASTIEQLSLQISDPEAQSYAQTIATMLYGTTLSEGFLTEVPGLSGNIITSKDPGYSKANALRDIYNGTRYAQTAVKQLSKGSLANDPAVKKIIRLANIAINKAKTDYPLDIIAQNALLDNTNASLADINRIFFNGKEGYSTKQSTINDLSLLGENPLPDLAKSTVKKMVVNNQLTPYTTVKATGEAAVTSDTSRY
jgi:Flp pilus assembly pilin Flp